MAENVKEVCNMKEQIMELLEDMNEAQLSHVLDYATNEYDEEGFEAHALELLIRTRENITLLDLRNRLMQRTDFPAASMAIVMEESDNILRKKETV